MNLLELLVKLGVDDQTSDAISNVTSGLTDKLGKAAKAAGAALAAAFAVDKVIDFGRAALDSYAEYEQLSGGISKLFGTAGKSLEEYAEQQGKSVDEVRAKYGELQEAEKLAMDNAQQAYKTAGMSANEYMANISSLSAALTSSLGGDTVTAAKQADVAMRAISDNVNTFGSDIDLVTNAFKNFAKQNYMMLDNLNLGYGGTKEEMERLIADANAWAEANGKAAGLSIESFSDVVTAIEYIQEKQNIAGATYNEAMTTIEGSINMTKAAWANLLTEFGKDDADVGARISELLESGMAALENIAPRVVLIIQNILDALPELIEQIQPYLQQIIDMVTAFAEEHQEEITAAAQVMWNGLIDALSLMAQAALSGLGELLGQIIETFPEWGPQLLEAAVVLFVNILQGIIEVTVSVLNGIADLIGQVLSKVVEAAGPMFENAKELFWKIVDGIKDTAGNILDSVGGAITDAVNHVGDFVSDMWNAGVDLIQGLIDGLLNNPTIVLDTLLGMAGDAVDGFLSWFGIASPSKRMREYGGYIMEGLAEGIADKASEAEKAMLEATQSLEGLASGKYLFEGNIVPQMALETPQSGNGGDVYNIYVRDGSEDVAVRIRNELHAYNLTRGR